MIEPSKTSNTPVIQMPSISHTVPTRVIILLKNYFFVQNQVRFHVSPSYGGMCTDRYITEDTNIASKFRPGFIAIFDKGFNVQDLFLYK